MEPEFVRTDGIRFTLQGQLFRIAGANNYYLGFGSDTMVQSVFEVAARMALNTLRTWAFLDCGDKEAVCFQWLNPATGKPEINGGPDGLERLDRTIHMAEQNGMRLILPLVNYWDDYGGVTQYLKWFGLTDKDKFYTHRELKDAYRNYAETLLLRVNTRTGRQYRDEPAILAWELANEPRCDSPKLLTRWANEMSSFLRALDPNHLIGVGDEGFLSERLLALPNIDFGTCHLYPNYSPREDAAAFGARWIREHNDLARRANKPMLMEEFGYRNEAGHSPRDAVFQTWLAKLTESEGAGALLWMIAGLTDDGPRYPDYDRYTVYGPDDAPSFVAFAQSATPTS